VTLAFSDVLLHVTLSCFYLDKDDTARHDVSVLEVAKGRISLPSFAAVAHSSSATLLAD
jgi:hypothetical protein